MDTETPKPILARIRAAVAAQAEAERQAIAQRIADEETRRAVVRQSWRTHLARIADLLDEEVRPYLSPTPDRNGPDELANYQSDVYVLIPGILPIRIYVVGNNDTPRGSTIAYYRVPGAWRSDLGEMPVVSWGNEMICSNLDRALAHAYERQQQFDAFQAEYEAGRARWIAEEEAAAETGVTLSYTSAEVAALGNATSAAPVAPTEPEPAPPTTGEQLIALLTQLVRETMWENESEH